MVAEGDRLRSARGVETTVYDLATCTETGKTIVIHGNKGGTMTTPLSLLLKRNFVAMDKRGVPVDTDR